MGNKNSFDIENNLAQGQEEDRPTIVAHWDYSLQDQTVLLLLYD